MDKSTMIWIASKYFEKGYDCEALRYGDDMYGKEKYTDEVWEYIVEAKEIGSSAFYEKYSDYKLY